MNGGPLLNKLFPIAWDHAGVGRLRSRRTKMIRVSPEILGLRMDNIRRKIADLRDLGFADTVKIITSLPSILSCNVDTIRGKLANLRDLGFADPVKMITSSPSILSCAGEHPRQVREPARSRLRRPGEDDHV